MKDFNKDEWSFNKDSKMVILTGAGASAESGIPTFRTGEDGLWLNYPVDVIAHPRGLRDNRDEFIEFYNKARKMTDECEPNDTHKFINSIQEEYGVYLITQNIDDLHERAGSKQVCHMHGSLYQLVCLGEDEHKYDKSGYHHPDEPCPECYHLMRPDVTLFTEEPKNIPEIYRKLDECTHLVLIGTSGEVYPAAGFKEYVKNKEVPSKVLNINIEIEYDYNVDFYIHKSSSKGIKELYEAIK